LHVFGVDNYTALQGYILGQYGLLYALENEQSVAALVILNTPLGVKTPLRPELAAYKSPLPFLRPKAGASFPADTYNAAGGPYAMAYKDAQAYLGGCTWLSAAQHSPHPVAYACLPACRLAADGCGL
jgi:pimeloyl-ACP methyl ester carboxylesterase